MIIPQTRTPIQVHFHSLWSKVNSVTTISKSERKQLSNYNWELLNSNDEVYNFEKARGKIVVINFWATWCPPCIAEMPSLQKLYSAYNDRVEFLFITTDSSEKVQAFKRKKGYTFSVFNPLSTYYPKELETSIIPRTLVINREGDIVVDETGAANWYSTEFKQLIEKLIQN